MKILLKLLLQKNLHVHLIDADTRREVITAYCQYEKDEFKKSFYRTSNATHYIMHNADVVFVGTLRTIHKFVEDFNEQ